MVAGLLLLMHWVAVLHVITLLIFLILYETASIIWQASTTSNSFFHTSFCPPLQRSAVLVDSVLVWTAEVKCVSVYSSSYCRRQTENYVKLSQDFPTKLSAAQILNEFCGFCVFSENNALVTNVCYILLQCRQ